MNFKLFSNDNGEVEVAKKAGSAYVGTTIPKGKAEGIIKSAKKVEKSDRFKEYGIVVNDDEMYIAGKLFDDEPGPTKKNK